MGRMMIRIKSLSPLVAGLALGACAGSGSGEYPSLATRDVERAQGQFDSAPVQRLDVPEVEVEGTGPLPQRLAALDAQARAAHGEFMAALPRTERLVRAAGGSAVGSDSWAAAQVALADLDSIRSRASVPLGDLDILFVAASVQADDTNAIAATRDAVIALVAEEDAALERLRGRVR